MPYFQNIPTTTVDKWCICPIVAIPVGAITALSNIKKAVQDVGAIALAAYRGRHADKPCGVDCKVKHAKEFSEAKQALWQHLTFIVIGILRIVPIVGALITRAYNTNQGIRMIEAGDKAAKSGDQELAISLYEQAVACNGSSDTMVKIGKIYENEGIPGKTKKELQTLSYQWMNRAAEAENGVGLFEVGECYLTGFGVTKHEESAFTFFKKAALKGNVDAQNRLASMYLNQEGILAVEDNDTVKKQEFYRLGVSWLEKAAAQGDKTAKFNLGFGGFNNLWGIKITKAEIYKYLKESSSETIEAKFLLGQMCLNSEGFDENGKQLSYNYSEEGKKLAFEWIEQAAKDDESNIEAPFILGNLCTKGAGVEKSDEQAVLWYQKAADKGHVQSMYLLGVYFSQQNTPESWELAFKYFGKAANTGHTKAQYVMGLMHTRDRANIPSLQSKDLSELDGIGFDWFQKAVSIPDSHFYLGNAFHHGYGVPRSNKIALEHFGKGSEMGSMNAQYALSVFFKKGLGEELGVQLSEDTFDAKRNSFYWLEKAAERGHDQAQLELTKLYRNGEAIFAGKFIDKNSEEAYKGTLKWLEAIRTNPQSTKVNIAEAEFLLGEYNAAGYGVEKSWTKASEHYKRAFEIGKHPIAGDRLRYLPINQLKRVGEVLWSFLPYSG